MELRDLSKINNPEFNFIVLSSITSLLLKKGFITEKELADTTEQTGSALQHLKHREFLDKSDE